MIYQNTLIQLISVLFSKEEKRLALEKISIHEHNCAVKGDRNIAGFICNQKVFRMNYRSTAYFLDPNIQSRANRFVDEMNQLDNDKRRITQMMMLVAKDADSPQILRDMLPESLVSLIRIDLPRCNEPGYLFKKTPLRHHQFEELVPKMHYYAMTHLLN